MFIKNVYLENFGPHENLELNFSKGLNGIYGRNGAGKSTAMIAAYAALTGDWSRHALGKQGCVKVGEKSCNVAIDLSLSDGSIATIARIISPKTSQRLVWGDYEVVRSEEIAGWLSSSFGLTKHILDNYMFIPQGEMYSFLDTSPKIRAERFAHLCGTEIADKIKVMLKAFQAEESKKSVMFLPLGTADIQKGVIAKLEEQRDSIKKEMDEELEKGKDFNFDANNEDIKKAYERLAYLMNAEQVYSRTEFAIKECDKEINNISVEYDKATEKQKKASLELVNKEDTVFGCEKLISCYEYQNLHREEYKICSSNLEKFKKDKDNLLSPGLPAAYSNYSNVQDINNAKGEYYKVCSKVDIYKAIINAGESDGCPVCGADSEHQKYTPDQYLSKLKEYEASKNNLGEWINNIENYIKEKESYDENVTNLNMRISNAEESLVKYKDIVWVSDKDYDTAKKWVAWKEAGEDMVDDLFKEANKLSMKLDNCKTKRESLEREFKDCYFVDKTEIATLQEKLDKYNEVAGAARVSREKISSLHGQWQVIVAQINNEKERLVEAEESEKNQLSHNKFVNLLSDASDVLGRDKLPYAIHRKVLFSLVERINYELASFEAPFVVTAETDLTFTAHFVSGPHKGLDITASALSGGQKVLLGFAYWFALQYMFASQIGVMVLDEPTDGLDKYNREKSVDVLAALRDRVNKCGQQVIIITHDETLMPVFNNVFIIGES